MSALIFLAALFFSAFTPSARHEGIVAPSGVAIAAAEVARLTSERFTPQFTPARDDWAPYAEPGGTPSAENGAIEKLDGAPWEEATVGRWSSCWWLSLYTGLHLCS